MWFVERKDEAIPIFTQLAVSYHFDTDEIINDSIGNVIARPRSDVLYKTLTLQHVDEYTLPPSKKYHPLDAQELAHRVPVDRWSQIWLDCIKQLHEYVYSVQDRDVDDDGDVTICSSPAECSLSIIPAWQEDDLIRGRMWVKNVNTLSSDGWAFLTELTRDE